MWNAFNHVALPVSFTSQLLTLLRARGRSNVTMHWNPSDHTNAGLAGPSLSLNYPTGTCRHMGQMKALHCFMFCALTHVKYIPLYDQVTRICLFRSILLFIILYFLLLVVFPSAPLLWETHCSTLTCVPHTMFMHCFVCQWFFWGLPVWQGVDGPDHSAKGTSPCPRGPGARSIGVLSRHICFWCISTFTHILDIPCLASPALLLDQFPLAEKKDNRE